MERIIVPNTDAATPEDAPQEPAQLGDEALQHADASRRVGPGERLRAAREMQERSQTEIAARLSLQPEIYAALETGDYARLSAPVYVRGHLRAAAETLGLPGDELVHAYELQRAAAETMPDDLPERPIAMPATPNAARTRTMALGIGAGMAFLAALIWIYTSQPSTGAQLTVKPSATEPATPDENASTDPTTYRLDDSENVPELAPRKDDLDQLTIRFSGESWIRVKDLQRRMLYEGWHRQGDHPRIVGRAPFNLVVGNMNAVKSMAMNDLPVALDGKRNSRDGSAVLIIGDPNATDLTLP